MNVMEVLMPHFNSYLLYSVLNLEQSHLRCAKKDARVDQQYLTLLVHIN
jgi:hypothetical protein